ncbi:MAG TPA: YceI family protein [Sandaracinaceae bacterium LLY-WYZ-13_1]|nr:YceI family protein [Sandaracinaceae bacterium LLY-WYZ-13_1]
MSSRPPLVLAALASLALAPAPAIAQASSADWTVSEEESLFYVQVFNDEGRLASGQAHDHVIRATGWTAELRFDPDAPQDCHFELSAPVRELAVDEPRMRRRLEYDGELDDEQRAEIRASMLGEDQLDADRYPEIRVEASRCRRVDDGQYRADVVVHMRGDEAYATARLGVSREGGRLRVRGRFHIRHEEVGMEPYQAFLGAVANAERIRFVVRLVARR